MKNTYCIIKVYAETNNEYVVKDNLTFDEAQEEFERYNSSGRYETEPCMYIIGDGVGNLEHVADENILDLEDEDFEENLEFLAFGSNFPYDDE